jgi:hypothetical protein
VKRKPFAQRKCHAKSRFDYQQSSENCKVSAIWLAPEVHMTK